MRKLCGFVGAALLMILAMPASAKETTVGELRGYCLQAEKAMDERREYDSFGAGMCIGLITGFTAGWENAFFVLDKNYDDQAGWCEPNGVDVKQRIKVFLSFADKTPALWQVHWVIGFYRSLSEAWRCKK